MVKLLRKYIPNFFCPRQHHQSSFILILAGWTGPPSSLRQGNVLPHAVQNRVALSTQILEVESITPLNTFCTNKVTIKLIVLDPKLDCF